MKQYLVTLSFKNIYIKNSTGMYSFLNLNLLYIIMWLYVVYHFGLSLCAGIFHYCLAVLVLLYSFEFPFDD
jgi:hypothetical protein